MRVAVGTLTVALGLALAGCVLTACGAGGSTADGEVSGERERERKGCGFAVNVFFAELRQLRARIAPGLTYTAYKDMVDALGLAQFNVRVTAPKGGCATAVAAAEKAFRSYQRAGTRWSACVRFHKCHQLAITLETRWKTAGRRLARADALLAGM